jgi:hypothetical protein
MSFGLTNAPTYFMYLMNIVFMEHLDKFLWCSSTIYWFAQEVKKSMKITFIWFCRDFEIINYTPS